MISRDEAGPERGRPHPPLDPRTGPRLEAPTPAPGGHSALALQGRLRELCLLRGFRRVWGVEKGVRARMGSLTSRQRGRPDRRDGPAHPGIRLERHAPWSHRNLAPKPPRRGGDDRVIGAFDLHQLGAGLHDDLQ